MFPSQKLCELGVHGHPGHASMGPGCFHPRNGGDVITASSFCLLQWGRDVSIPEIMRTRRTWASRPRFNGDGMFPSQKWWRRDHRKFLLFASMGPGCFHPRNYANSAYMGIQATLQWGRDVSIPEMVAT